MYGSLLSPSLAQLSHLPIWYPNIHTYIHTYTKCAYEEVIEENWHCNDKDDEECVRQHRVSKIFIKKLCVRSTSRLQCLAP